MIVTEESRQIGRGRRSRQAIYQLLKRDIDDLKNRLGGLPAPVEAEDIWGDIWYREVHNSTAIEGNTLVLKEVEILLHDGRAVGNKDLGDYLEVSGYADAARWIYAQGRGELDWQHEQLISVAEIRHIHELAMSPVWQVRPHDQAGPGEGPGGFRHHDIQEFPGCMRPPPWTDVPMLLDDWVRHVTRILDDPSPFPEALADHHARFEQVHPFLDGNGRTGRLLTNLILIRLGYPPAILPVRDRTKYLNALRKADQGDVGPLGEMFARRIIDTLNRFIHPAVAGPARLLPLPALADGEVTARALREAAARGRLHAVRETDGRWLSSRRWVNEYKRSRTKGGRPRRGE